MPKASEIDELRQFAEERRRQQTRCWACRLPQDIRRTIEEARTSGTSVATLVAFRVQRKGQKDATRDKLFAHFEAGHHERA